MANYEGILQSEIARYAKTWGWLFRAVQWRGRRNCPDGFFARNGMIIFIEFKMPDEKPRVGQKEEIQTLRDAGVIVYVVDNLQDGYAIFDEV